MVKTSNLDTAQDYMDCVAGLHGPEWQEAADAFIEKNIAASPTPWAEWAAQRSAPLLSLDDADGCGGYRSDCARLGKCQCDRLGRE